jgi:hypothetical protein
MHTSGTSHIRSPWPKILSPALSLTTLDTIVPPSPTVLNPGPGARRRLVPILGPRCRLVASLRANCRLILNLTGGPLLELSFSASLTATALDATACPPGSIQTVLMLPPPPCLICYVFGVNFVVNGKKLSMLCFYRWILSAFC